MAVGQFVKRENEFKADGADQLRTTLEYIRNLHESKEDGESPRVLARREKITHRHRLSSVGVVYREEEEEESLFSEI